MFAAIGQQYFFQRQFSLGQGTGFIGEQEIQTPRGFNAYGFADQNKVLLHPLDVGGQHHADHHGQPFGNRHHDDGGGQGDGMDQLSEHKGRGGELNQHTCIGHAAFDTNAVE